MKSTSKVKLVKGKLAAKDASELATILKGKAQVKPEKVKPEAVAPALHKLAVSMAAADSKVASAENAVYAAFKAYAMAALPIIVKSAAHLAAVTDIKAVYGVAREAAGIQRITMLNSIRTIAHGKAATRSTAAQPAQGVDVVIEALDACESLPALRKALQLMKLEAHGATGKAKHGTDKPQATGKVKADAVVIPESRAEAIKAACRILEYVKTHILKVSESAISDEVEHVIATLRKVA